MKQRISKAITPTKKIKRLSLVFLLPILLVSCDNLTSQSSGFNQYNPNIDIKNETNPYRGGRDYFTEISRTTNYASPSTGNVKALVVPVAFDGYDYMRYYFSSSVDTIDDNFFINRLEEAFFGEGKSYESVSSFYYKSSYGKLNITGDVSDIFHTSLSVQEVSSLGVPASNQIAEEFLETTNINLDEYDSDKDGKVDLMWFVYLYPHDYKGVYDVFWAYTTWLNDPSLKISNYSWASFNFLTYYVDDMADSTDTYIHETGHQFGLDDYYDYDGLRAPLGGCDMMDTNTLDHNAFSKYCLGWTDPIVGEVGKTYTLKPFQENGDSLILASNFNGSCYDEYFILEYYTPTGLNYYNTHQDVSVFKEGFNINGLKILHVDSRIGRVSFDDKYIYWDGYTYDVPPVTSSTSYYTINSNTPSSCFVTEDWALVSLVEADNEDTLMKMATETMMFTPRAENSDLFTPNTLKFGSQVYNNYVANEGWKIPCEVEITSMNEDGITITLNSL